MLTHRIVTSLILLALTYLVFFNAPNYVFAITVGVFFAIGVYELLKMYKISLVNIVGVIGLFFVVCYFIIFRFEYESSQIIRGIAVGLWCFVVPFILVARPTKIYKFLVCLIAIIVFSVATYSMVILKDLLGGWQLISIMAIAWVADIGAYFIGRLYGKHKLAPHISPGKSIEGAIAGMVFVLIYLSILKYFNLVVYLYNYIAVLKFGIILVIVSVVGDLFESWLKRVAGVKDSGIILPGHGGVFDRVDSLMAVMTLAYAMIRGIM